MYDAKTWAFKSVPWCPVEGGNFRKFQARGMANAGSSVMAMI